jgi:nitroreductase
MKDRLLEMARLQATSAQAFGVLTTSVGGRAAELAAGAALLRVNLAATALGIAFQPLNAPLEGRMAIPSGLLPDDEIPHILFRIGYAEDAPPAPRRTLFEVVQL